MVEHSDALFREMPTNTFSRSILKTLVGKDRAQSVFQRLLQLKEQGESEFSEIPSSLNQKTDYATIFKTQLISLSVLKGMQNAQSKYVTNKNVDTYFEDDSSSNSSLDSIENAIVEAQLEKEMKKKQKDDSSKIEKEVAAGQVHQLIDWELVILLRYCSDQQRNCKSGSNPSYEEAFLEKSIEIGSKSKQKTVILEIEDVLIKAEYSDQKTGNWEPCFSFQHHGKTVEVKKRPFLKDLLTQLQHKFEIIIFTRFEEDFARQILPHIDEKEEFFTHVLTRSSCLNHEGFLIKDLDLFMDREQKDFALVDTSILSFAFHLDSGLPVCPYNPENSLDQELLYLIAYFEQLYFSTDVQKQLSDSLKLIFLQENTDTTRFKLDHSNESFVSKHPIINQKAGY